MAKTILLNTSTADFLELIGNDKTYHVPTYQRDYSWTKEQWEDLWTDVVRMHSQDKEQHYMGALVIGLSDRNREFKIIDGQQRLATLSILALAVLKQLQVLIEQGVEPELNKERAQKLRDRFIGEKDPSSLQESSKLVLNETDNAFYQDYLVQLREPDSPQKLSKSNKFLWECFCYFVQQLSELDKVSKDGKELAALLNETIARQLLFILISVDDELNAYTVFETLNARGLELSSTDLIKNYLFSLVKAENDLKSLYRRWGNLIETVRQERFPEFLRYHLLCKDRQVRSQQLFRTIRDSVRTPGDVFELMEALEHRKELFAAISDPYDDYWAGIENCRPYVKELNLFRVPQMMPLLFAARERFNDEDFTRVLKLVSIITFRYTVVSGLNPNELEPAYYDAANGILNGRLTGLQAVFDQLKSIYVNDDRFRENFSLLELSGRRKRLAKYGNYIPKSVDFILH